MHQHYIMPGQIDLNVSFHPDYEDQAWEDIENLTKTALSCGITLIVNHPILCSP